MNSLCNIGNIIIISPYVYIFYLNNLYLKFLHTDSKILRDIIHTMHGFFEKF